jgi:hypothetical protein
MLTKMGGGRLGVKLALCRDHLCCSLLLLLLLPPQLLLLLLTA